MSSGDYDYKVKVVDDAGQADWSVFAVDGIDDLSPDVGDILVWDGAAWATKDGDGIASNTQTDSYTLALTDKGKVVEMNKATAVTLTIPTNATVAFPVGTVIEVYQMGAGQVTVAAAGGVTLRAARGAKTAAQYTTASLRKRDTDTWVLSGDTTS